MRQSQPQPLTPALSPQAGRGGQRIVSLIASATEIVCALGAARAAGGAQPRVRLSRPTCSRLPALTARNSRSRASSAEIDARVREIVRDGLSVYRVDGEALKALAPDVIVTQDHCEVCAVSLYRRGGGHLHAGPGSRSTSSRCGPTRIADVYADIARVARALRVPEAGSGWSARCRTRLAAVRTSVAGRPRPRVAFIEWVEPLMAGGNWMPELIEIAGGHNLFGEAGKHSDWMRWDGPGRRRPGGDRGGALRLRPGALPGGAAAAARPSRDGPTLPRSETAASTSPTATPISTAPARAWPTAPRCWWR